MTFLNNHFKLNIQIIYYVSIFLQAINTQEMSSKIDTESKVVYRMCSTSAIMRSYMEYRRIEVVLEPLVL